MKSAGPLSQHTTISIVMPVYNGRHQLEKSLGVVLRDPCSARIEVIVVDDGSTDGSGEYAAGQGARVLLSGGIKLGPARARNVGVEQARGEVVVFVDADVVLKAGALDRIARAFDDPSTTALYGSYDDAPSDRGFGSQYMNLRHHLGHQAPSDDSSTFWSGIGAVRRAAFLELDGFDAATYPWPSIEDIDLGMRLRQAGGRIRRLPEIQGTHLKVWTLREVIRVDVFRRALPWSRLMLANPGSFSELNVSALERVKALLAITILPALVAVTLFGLSPWALVVLLLMAVWLNRSLFKLFLRQNGSLFACGALLFHQLHYVYSSAVYVYCVLEAHWRPRDHFPAT